MSFYSPFQFDNDTYNFLKEKGFSDNDIVNSLILTRLTNIQTRLEMIAEQVFKEDKNQE